MGNESLRVCALSGLEPHHPPTSSSHDQSALHIGYSPLAEPIKDYNLPFPLIHLILL